MEIIGIVVPSHAWSYNILLTVVSKLRCGGSLSAGNFGGLAFPMLRKRWTLNCTHIWRIDIPEVRRDQLPCSTAGILRMMGLIPSWCNVGLATISAMNFPVFSNKQVSL